MSDRKYSTKRALERYFDKQARRNDPLRKKRSYGAPEKEVEKEVMAWLKENDFSCDVVESKAVFNRSAGTYVSGQTVKGMSDIVGCTPDGMGCFIELKAHGRRSQLKIHQRKFLLAKMMRGAFACVVDSVDYLEECWDCFQLGGDMTEKLPRVKKEKSPPSEDLF